MTIENRNLNVRSWLRTMTVIANLVILLAMVSSIVFPFQGGGDLHEKYVHLMDNQFNYSIRFVFFSVLSIPAVIALIILAFFTERGINNRLLDVSGVVFLIPYIVFVSIAYCSQYLVFPYMVKYFSLQNITAFDAWCFTSKGSIPYPFALIGYAFYGVGSFFIGYKFLSQKGAVRAMALLLYIQGICSVLAIVFHGLHFRHVGEICSIVSGALSVPYFLTLYVASKDIRFIQEE